MLLHARFNEYFLNENLLGVYIIWKSFEIFEENPLSFDNRK